MIKATHSRKGKTITEIASGKAETFKTVNEAKRASLKLTKANGLGSIVKA